MRGPLSQLFSALYLKSLDDTLSQADVFYLRYQDDVIILAKSLRQLNRCKQKVMGILNERKLTLSRKKTRIGLVSEEFHFLGVNYLEMQPQDNTKNTCVAEVVQIKSIMGGVKPFSPKAMTSNQTAPHLRTLRKARETVKSMVTHGFAATEIKNYLSRWCSWWAKTNAQWTYQQLLIEFIQTTHQTALRVLAQALFEEQFGRLRTNATTLADDVLLAQVTL